MILIKSKFCRLGAAETKTNPKQKTIMKASLILIVAAAFLQSAFAQLGQQPEFENFDYYKALKEKYLGKEITVYVTSVERDLDDKDGTPVFQANCYDSKGNLAYFDVRVPKDKVEEFVKKYGTENQRTITTRIPGMVFAGDFVALPMKGELVEYMNILPEYRLQVYPSTKPAPSPTPKPKATPAVVDSRIPKFLIAQNLEGDRDFVLHCQSPRFLWDISTQELLELDPVPGESKPALMREVREFVKQVMQSQ